ncbi:hypothetical protein CLV90_2803 [Maribacter spongiicola]|uniref:Uncharacterized protein n=1 Tax=Maribacter spongiicola TaxID=1206753 RepID=A0A4R7JYT1_9FLAO|nr:hypothetical protein CLV90_2803 [Maribacter spongiicola]
MAFKNSNELSLFLQQYQLDYYTKGNALKVHSILTNVMPTIQFKNDKFAVEFNKRCEDLKNVEDLTNIHDYSEKFAENLLKIILMVNSSTLSTEIE